MNRLFTAGLALVGSFVVVGCSKDSVEPTTWDIGDPEATSADGAAIEVTGILSIYNGAAQFTLLDVDDVRLVN